MKFVLAPDSFKNALRSPEVCAALTDGIRMAQPEAEILAIPLADGGEGTVRAAALAAEGVLEQYETSGPLGAPLTAETARLPGGGAVVEMASAAGLELLSPDGCAPLEATTFGVGLLLRQLLDSGCRDFVIGLGGSATTDGGAGMLQALGARFYDDAGRLLPEGIGGGGLSAIRRADLSGLLPELAASRIRIASDVTNPLTGPQGAAAVFAPQKGASAAEAELLDAGLRHYAALFGDDGSRPGDGAAGGMGFALRKLLHGRPESGAELLLELAGFDRRVVGADFVITGEGRSDSQSAAGKLCVTVARRAARAGVPTILCSGSLGPGSELLETEFAACFSCSIGPEPLEEALAATRERLTRFSRNLTRLLTSNPSR